jgi:mannose-1-phosphate guanylyltransferase
MHDSDHDAHASAPMPAFWSVIPAGGSGTRLWPLSRAAKPKFLLPLTGDRSLIQLTVDRLAPLSPPERTLVVCGPSHATGIARQVAALPEGNFVIEPSPKGSGPAIALAAALIARADAGAIMGSFAADHVVANEPAFINAVRHAIAAAENDWLVTIGLTPTRPETGYGYIERSSRSILPQAPETAFEAVRFVEKPNLETATAYCASGQFLWNASMFIWKVSVFLEELRRSLPALHAGVSEIAAAWETPARERTLARVWAQLDETTIDTGVMERAERFAVVPAELGWSDVGDWHGLGELIDPDEDGNRIHGTLVQLHSRDSVVWSETNRMVALIGVDHAVVVDTPDALLVIDRARAQDVRRIVEKLKKAGRMDLS